MGFVGSQGGAPMKKLLTLTAIVLASPLIIVSCAILWAIVELEPIPAPSEVD